MKNPSSLSPDVAARISRLADQIMHHKRLYYAGHPEISDAEYDRMEDQLRALEADHPALRFVGTEEAADLPKVNHAVPMLSLQKTYDVEELTRWRGNEPVVGTLKVDGVSLSLVYRDGRFVQAKTRGNGVTGEDVTAKVHWIAEVPKVLAVPYALEVRGEIFCRKDRFLALSDTMAEYGLDRPTSPRNIVAGLLGRKTAWDLARFFGFFAFNVLDPGDRLGLRTESDQLQWLGANGFVLPEPALLESDEAVRAYLERVRAWMGQEDVPIDGAVFSYNNLALQQELGNTSHHPRYKMSFKWQGETATSVIREISWATSRLGIVTPVAVIEPTRLSGAEITNVTLHNAEHVRAFNLKPGDTIEIVRSGEVIPKFLQVVQAVPGMYAWPETCPSCATGLEFDGVRLKCPAVEGCPAQKTGAILNWIRCAGIDDLSEKRLVPLVELGKVRGMADLYRLKPEDFLVIPQTREKMAAKLFANIHRTRTLPLAAFLNGLGIEGTGLTSWEKILEHFPDLDALLAANAAQIAAIDGFAEKTAGQIVDGLQQRRALIADLLAAGVQPVPPDAGRRGSGDGPLAGKTIVITGALSRPRSEVEQAIKAAGGRTSSSVSKATFAVVTDDPGSDSSKMKKARSLGILTWSEADLWTAIGHST